MQWIELNNVEYGDCTVLGGKKHSMLMVDCGSMNQKLRTPEMDMSDVFSFIRHRYEGMSEKHFLLTHYHRDHLCGLLQILRESPGYFDRVYIPYLPKDGHGNSPLLDFAVFAYVFLAPQTDCSQVNTSCLSIFKKLRATVGADRIFTLGAGDTFLFDSAQYEILSPDKENFGFDSIFAEAVEQMNTVLSDPHMTGVEGEFLRRKSIFTHCYYNCLAAFALEGRRSPERRLALLDSLETAFLALEDIRPEVCLSPAVHDITELFDKQAVRTAYSEAANAASLIFQNIRKTEASLDDILMTGDATDDTMQRIYEKLYAGYFIVKAPHHGTASGYSNIFKDIGMDHLLISSGDYHAGGEIAPEYTAMETVKHCTGTAKCKWFQTSGGCCNRLNYCYDQPGGAGLTIKCPATKFSGESPQCRIYVVAAPGSGRSCFCDVEILTDSALAT